MATLYVTEYWGAGRPQSADGYLGAPLASQSQPSYTQLVAITGSTQQSAAFRDTTILIRVHTDAICSVEVGTLNPVASTSSARMAANQTEYFSVRGGEKIAVIQNV
jgi:hypothetical protein